MTSKVQSVLLILMVKAHRSLPAIYHYARFRLGLVRINISDDLLYTLAYHIHNRGIDYPFNDYDDYDEFRCAVEIPLRCEMSQTRKNNNFITLGRLMYRMRDNIHLHIVKYLRCFDAWRNKSIIGGYTDQFAYDLAMMMYKYWLKNNKLPNLTKMIEHGFLDDLKLMEECKKIIDELPPEAIFQIDDYRKYQDSFTDVRRWFIIHG